MLIDETVCSLTDEELVFKAQNGDKLYEEILINRYKNCVNFCSSKYYMQGMEKEDIIQEGMIGLCNAIKDFNPIKTSFKSFAILCISRRIITILKNSNRQKNIPLNTSVSLDSLLYDEQQSPIINSIQAPVEHNPEEALIIRETLKAYDEKINDALSPLELKVFKCYTQGLSYSDIAKILDITVKSVDNAVQRIRKKLEAVLI